MAWNQPLPKKEQKKTTLFKTILCSAVFVGLCAICAMFFLQRQDDESEFVEPQKKQYTKPQKTSKQPVSKDPIVKTEEPKPLSKLEAGIYVDERGIKRYPGGLRVTDKNEKIAPRVDFKKLNPPRFKNVADEQIAMLIEIEPGAGVFGSIPYGDAFDKQFLKSLEEEAPLIDLEEGKIRSEYDIELQRCVLDAKKEMLDRYKKGEKPSLIMAETRAELQRLGQYTHQLRQQVIEIMSDAQYSDSDVQDFKQAANEMLKQKGLPELSFPSMVFRQHYINNKRTSNK